MSAAAKSAQSRTGADGTHGAAVPASLLAEDAARILKEGSGLEPPRLHLVLGSGLGGVADAVQDPTVFPFAELPGFPPTTVPGHAGQFVTGRIAGVSVLVQQGRYHYYEGWGSDVIGMPVRTGRAAGAETILLANAAGGIRPDLAPGSLMLLDDHISMSFRAPLAGPVREGEARFPDMTRPYDPALLAAAERAALESGLRLVRGTYAMVLGPAFETPAEIRALRAAGADAVGMSTVPEVIVARALGQRVLAISLISNRAAGLASAALDHEDVMAWAETAGQTLAPFLESVVPKLAGDYG